MENFKRNFPSFFWHFHRKIKYIHCIQYSISAIALFVIITNSWIQLEKKIDIIILILLHTKKKPSLPAMECNITMEFSSKKLLYNVHFAIYAIAFSLLSFWSRAEQIKRRLWKEDFNGISVLEKKKMQQNSEEFLSQIVNVLIWSHWKKEKTQNINN